jgi:hypothetical protein
MQAKVSTLKQSSSDYDIEVSAGDIRAKFLDSKI